MHQHVYWYAQDPYAGHIALQNVGYFLLQLGSNDRLMLCLKNLNEQKHMHLL